MLHSIISPAYREFSLFYIYLCTNHCSSVKMYIHVHVLYCINHTLVYEFNIVKRLKFKWHFKTIDRLSKTFHSSFTFINVLYSIQSFESGFFAQQICKNFNCTFTKEVYGRFIIFHHMKVNIRWYFPL